MSHIPGMKKEGMWLEDVWIIFASVVLREIELDSTDKFWGVYEVFAILIGLTDLLHDEHIDMSDHIRKAFCYKYRNTCVCELECLD